jgi:hypothetical protein
LNIRSKTGLVMLAIRNGWVWKLISPKKSNQIMPSILLKRRLNIKCIVRIIM